MKNLNKLTFLSLLQLFLSCGLLTFEVPAHQASAGPGSLDTTFNGTGIAITLPDLPFIASTAEAIAIQVDGRIVVAGITASDKETLAVVNRYLPDGTLDLTFGGTGSVRTGLPGLTVEASAVAIQSDGKIVIAGRAYSEPIVRKIFVARYNSDGSLDVTFNGTGIIAINIGSSTNIALSSLVAQPDGKIVAAGKSYILPNWDFLVVRFNENGSLDPAFNGTGFAITQVGGGEDVAQALALQPDNKIVVAGYARVTSVDKFAVVRFNSDGNVDATFNGTGQVITTMSSSNNSVLSVAVQPDGKLVAGGYCSSVANINNTLCLARYQGNGTLDTSFNGTGTINSQFGVSSYATSISLQSDGKVIAAGSGFHNSRFDFLVVRFNSNGSLDTSFGGVGFVNTPIQAGSEAHAVAIQRDGKIIAAGYTYKSDFSLPWSIALARYNAAQPVTAFDYDGDGKSDISVYRPSDGGWYLLRSTAGFLGVGFGTSTDKVVPADYDGDGKTDVAVYRPSTGVWYILNSSNSTLSYYNFGVAEDLPAPADYDGDGKADITVFRPSSGTFYRQNSSNGAISAVQFGANGDKPTVGDFDGDGKADLALFRSSAGAWYRLNSSNGAFVPTQFGVSTDLTVPADYDGDGKTDIAVYRASIGYWYLLNSSNGAFVATNFGLTDDIPAPGDFDGDGKADLSVFRPSDGAWYRLNSSNGGFFAQQFGANGDMPTPAAFRY